MMFPNDRESLRRYYAAAWRKYRENVPMAPLEMQIADVVALHPEYHGMLETGEISDEDFDGADGRSNPFLHMGLHLAVRDQLATDRPPGFAAEYRRMAAATGDLHDVEHRIMELLAESLWEAQQAGSEPDELAYLDRVRHLAVALCRS